jgi:biopolymer transport protein ExbB
MHFPRSRPIRSLSLLLGALLVSITAHASGGGEKDKAAWWDKEWSVRKKVTIDTGAAGIPEPVGGAVVLLRLHDGNFQFAAAKEDGTDLRIVAEDGKTLLTFHIERYDALMNEAFVWVRVPEVKPGAQTNVWLYYGNAGPKAVSVNDAKGTFDVETVLAYHFTENGAPPADATSNGNTAQTAGVPVQGALIAGGVRLIGQPIVIPASPSLAWTEGGAMTWSGWVKPAALAPNAAVFGRRGEGASFVVGLDNGTPYLDVSGQRAAAAAPLAANGWAHLAAVAEPGRITLYVNGESAATLAAGLPALNSPAQLGGDGSDGSTGGFQGELDEVQLSRVARPAGWVKLAAFGQGGAKAEKLLAFGSDEQGEAGWMDGEGHFVIIIKNLTFDGWLVIGILAVMMVISWWLMWTKISYLNALTKGNALFMKAWGRLASDLTALDNGDPESVKTLGGLAKDKKSQRALKKSSVYRIYHVGSEEIRHRLHAEGGFHGLRGRSIQAIRAALDGTLVREKQKIDRLIVLLTICISGGPFLGLLGTVVGVMITFAAVAAAGDVNVNAIAPGIAAALLATVAGLAVAIPALFGYNYILARVKDATADMHVFIDEFVAKMAEFYAEEKAPGATSQSGKAVMREAVAHSHAMALAASEAPARAGAGL